MADSFEDRSEFVRLAEGCHGDPFAVLGRHELDTGCVIRTLAPGAEAVEILDRASGAALGRLLRRERDVVFEGYFEERPEYLLKIYWPGGAHVTEDPYGFPPLLSDFDLHLMAEGRHRDLASCLGACPMEVEDVAGVRFAVWAPNAQRVSVVGDFNGWDGRRYPMRLRHRAGVWEIFIPRLAPGVAYKYEILGAHGVLPLKADPVARQLELPPATASIVAEKAGIVSASAPLRQNGRQGPDTALAIYEVHAASWMRHYDGRSYDWDELAARLIPYVVDLGFTHIEFLPVMGHPFRGSWGYQPLSQFAPMPELGTPHDFMKFVERCHGAGVGVILDWVPAHFPSDAHGLAQFDGTPLYEHADPREGFHQDWNTLIYNLGRNEVRGFLIASALFWLEHFGVDGLRVDAVASMLYRDYSRAADAWIPNIYGGRENLEAIGFLQELSEAIAERCPGALLIAEESTAWPGVTKPAAEHGLGFSHKWNMGWMHDTLHYMQEDPVNRQYHHNEMSFGLVYAFSERFVLPISHDEVVHGKRSLLGRMPGDEWQRFANLRAYLAFMWAHPGKKLLFMGCEFAQPGEWGHDSELPWHLLQYGSHRGVQSLVRDLNMVYRREGALYQCDFDARGFRWVVGDDAEQSVYAFLRFGDDDRRPVLVLCNFTPVPRHDYEVGVPFGGGWREIFNSDAAIYGGSNLGNHGRLQAHDAGRHGLPASLRLSLPPLATIILHPEV